AFVFVEEVVAPVERRAQGALTLGRGARTSCEDRELVVEAVCELPGCEHAQPRRCELDRQRDPLERNTGAIHRSRAVTPCSSRYTLTQQLDRVLVHQSLDYVLRFAGHP